jgi:hypothetical protein
MERDYRSDLGFSTRTYESIDIEEQINGVDLFVILLVLYRTRRLSYLSGEWTDFAQETDLQTLQAVTP